MTYEKINAAYLNTVKVISEESAQWNHCTIQNIVDATGEDEDALRDQVDILIEVSFVVDKTPDEQNWWEKDYQTTETGEQWLARHSDHDPVQPKTPELLKQLNVPVFPETPAGVRSSANDTFNEGYRQGWRMCRNEFLSQIVKLNKDLTAPANGV